ncbi:MAG: EamA family transporter, partial [Candidatus Methanomethylophilaceae archaeon]|nr:EamA family transporter [Candidatus Methanomethylophilaceae archaeon]
TIVSVPFADVWDVPGKVVGWNVVFDLLCMGVLMTLVPYYLQIYALRYISPVTVNIIGLLEVASAVIVGWIIYDESLGLLNLIGIILIPASIVLVNVDVRKRLRERELRQKSI